MIYDISLPLSKSLARWPGDEPYNFSHSALMAEGATNNVGIIHGCVHFGTHIDAPYHFRADGATVEQLNLEVYCGVAAVVDATGYEELTLDLFEEIDLAEAPRILIKTGAWKDHNVFPEAFPVLARGVPEFLGRAGVKLVGVDVPSVDKFGGETLVNHYGLDSWRVLIMESLDLSRITPGLYELIALPLKIVGGDGSMVRAVLRDLPVKAPEGNRTPGQ
jgi:arylformamidase